MCQLFYIYTWKHMTKAHVQWKSYFQYAGKKFKSMKFSLLTKGHAVNNKVQDSNSGLNSNALLSSLLSFWHYWLRDFTSWLTRCHASPLTLVTPLLHMHFLLSLDHRHCSILFFLQLLPAHLNFLKSFIFIFSLIALVALHCCCSYCCGCWCHRC